MSIECVRGRITSKVAETDEREMPTMQTKVHRPIAVVCADIHLRTRPPVARAESREEWLAVQANYLTQLKNLSTEFKCPILGVGDIFHQWNSSPELINFAIKNLPYMYAIPGNHDLPLHNYADIHKSAYWTLVEAGKITDLPSGKKRMVDKPLLAVTAFPCGTPLINDKASPDVKVSIAIVHAYVWKDGHTHPGAPLEQHVKHYKKLLDGYDVVFFGDNHSGFIHKEDGLTIVNCGGFMRTRADEVDYEPKVWLLYPDGKVIPHKLDVSKDKFGDLPNLLKMSTTLDINDFLETLEDLQDISLDYRETCLHYIKKNKVSNDIKKILLSSMESAK